MDTVKQIRLLQPVLYVLRLFVFTNIFISVCSLVMGYYTFVFFSLPVNNSLLVFIVSGTLCSYSFHWFLPSGHPVKSPREKWSIANKPILIILALIGFAGAVYSFLSLELYSSLIIPILLLTFLYSAGKIPFGPFQYMRKYFIGKTIYLAMVWTLVTVYLPLITSPGVWNEANTFFMLNRFFLLLAICILFDLRDKDADAAQGIKSLITILSRSYIKYLFFAGLLLSVLFGLPLLNTIADSTGIIILLLPSLITAISYSYSIKTRSELWFYFFLDGIMMLSGFLYILCRLLSAL